MEEDGITVKEEERTPWVSSMLVIGIWYFWYFYLFATQLHYLKMPKEKKKKNVGRDGEEA